MHLKLRTWTGSPGTDEPVVGEPFWDPINSRLGIFNNRDGKIEWYPISKDHLQLLEDQELRGTDTAGTLNPIALSFDAVGKLRIIYKPTDVVLAEFAAAGNSFHAVSSMPPPVLSYGLANRIVNAALVCVRNLIPHVGLIETSAPSWVSPVLLAPNWLVWKSSGAPGHIACSVSTVVPPGLRGVTNSAKITATGAPTNSGIRLFVDVNSFDGEQVTLSAYVKGASAKVMRMRARTPTGGTLAILDITGTGDWQRVTLTFTPPESADNWMFVDFYDFSHAASAATDWYVAAPQINVGANVWAFESRSAEVEKSLVRSIYRERYVMFDGDAGLANHTYDLDLVDAGSIRAVMATEDSSTPAVVSVTPQYVKVSKSSPATGKTLLKIMAFNAPTSVETN